MNKLSRVETLLPNRVGFLSEASAADDIAISSRIRLARNLAGNVFPGASGVEERFEVMEKIGEAVAESSVFRKDFLSFYPSEMSAEDQEVLFERRLVSRELLSRVEGAALFCRRDENCSLMVNEEDHLRLQSMRAGFQLHQAWEALTRIDDKLSGQLDYAYDARWGYLTSCPTNLGTGMRSSVMLHLPGLVLTGEISKVIYGIGKMRFAVRGIFGEGTDNRGNLFQISNQSTLGESEVDIIAHLEGIVSGVINAERQARAALMKNDAQGKLLDIIGRAFGILKYSHRIGAEEALNLLSMLRLGVDSGAVKSIGGRTVNDIFIGLNRAHLQKNLGRELSPEEENVERAAFIRRKMREGEER